MKRERHVVVDVAELAVDVPVVAVAGTARGGRATHGPRSRRSRRRRARAPAPRARGRTASCSSGARARRSRATTPRGRRLARRRRAAPTTFSGQNASATRSPPARPCAGRRRRSTGPQYSSDSGSVPASSPATKRSQCSNSPPPTVSGTTPQSGRANPSSSATACVVDRAEAAEPDPRAAGARVRTKRLVQVSDRTLDVGSRYQRAAGQRIRSRVVRHRRPCGARQYSQPRRGC